MSVRDDERGELEDDRVVPRRAGEVGAGVAAILEAAEDAAGRIESEARKQAADLIRNTEEAVEYFRQKGYVK